MSHLAAWEQRVTLGHLGAIRLVPSVCWGIPAPPWLLLRELEAAFPCIFKPYQTGRGSHLQWSWKRTSLQITWELTVQVPSLFTGILNPFPLRGMTATYRSDTISTSFLPLSKRATNGCPNSSFTMGKITFNTDCALFVKKICSVKLLQELGKTLCLVLKAVEENICLSPVRDLNQAKRNRE